jgi:hypothetical protein
MQSGRGLSNINYNFFLANKRLCQAIGDKSLIIIHFGEEEGIIIIHIKSLYFPKKVKNKKSLRKEMKRIGLEHAWKISFSQEPPYREVHFHFC